MGRDGHDGVPIRADMATIINTPSGIAESSVMRRQEQKPLSSDLLHKRKDMRQMLISRLMQEHGSDPIRKALISREVDASAALRSGQLTAQGLATLERAVAVAVKAAEPGLHALPSPVRPRGDPSTDFAVKLKTQANWTDVAKHRAGFYVIEQQRKELEKQRRVDDMREKLAHQLAENRFKHSARSSTITEEAKAIEKVQEEYRQEQQELHAKRLKKIEVERNGRAEQIQEQQARRAATERLRQLEDEELLLHLRKEQAADEMRKDRRREANEKYHRETALANVHTRQKKEEIKKRTWEEDVQYNREWKEFLDKQEADRTGQYERLRERIRKMQRMYEDNTGAEAAAKEAKSEAMRQMWADKHEAELRERDRVRAQKRQDEITRTTKHLLDTMGEHRSARDAEKQRDRVTALVLKEEAEAEEQRERDKKAMARARALQQQHQLNEQMLEKRSNKARDPGAAEMTDLEASLNRSLLVSMMQHSYDNMTVLN